MIKEEIMSIREFKERIFECEGKRGYDVMNRPSNGRSYVVGCVNNNCSARYIARKYCPMHGRSCSCKTQYVRITYVQPIHVDDDECFL